MTSPSDQAEAERRYPMEPQPYMHDPIASKRAAYIAGREDERTALAEVMEYSDDVDKLRRHLKSRDEFIVAHLLWEEFVNSLSSAALAAAGPATGVTKEVGISMISRLAEHRAALAAAGPVAGDDNPDAWTDERVWAEEGGVALHAEADTGYVTLTIESPGSLTTATIARYRWERIVNAARLRAPVAPDDRLCCADCGLLYSSPDWADFVIPDDAWARISHREGVLCANCMVKRAVQAGVECEGRFTSGPFADHEWRKPPVAPAPIEPGEGDAWKIAEKISETMRHHNFAEHDLDGWITSDEQMAEFDAACMVAARRALAASPPPAAASEPELVWTDWQPWVGGECPVKEYESVQVRYRSNGTTEQQASRFRWTHTGAWDDVLAYRVRRIKARDGIEAQRGLNDVFPGDLVPSPAAASDSDELLTIIARSIGRTASVENHIKRAQDVVRSVRDVDLAFPTPTAARTLAAAAGPAAGVDHATAKMALEALEAVEAEILLDGQLQEIVGVAISTILLALAAAGPAAGVAVTDAMREAYYDLVPVAPGTETWAMAGLPSADKVWAAMSAAALATSPPPAAAGVERERVIEAACAIAHEMALEAGGTTTNEAHWAAELEGRLLRALASEVRPATRAETLEGFAETLLACEAGPAEGER